MTELEVKAKKMPTKEILCWVNEIIVESKKENMTTLRNKSRVLYVDAMVNKFPLFYESYSQIFALACLDMTEDNKKRLGQMLAMHDHIKKKKISKLRGEYIIGEELAKSFAPGLL